MNSIPHDTRQKIWEIVEDIFHGRHGFPSAFEIYTQIHRHPELSWQEYKTARLVATCLQNHHVKVKVFLEGRGIVAFIDGDDRVPTAGMRADMDALPVQEQTGVEYSSQINGVMHACGHDMHTTILLATILAIKKNRWIYPGKVMGFFQPAEEVIPSGAKIFLEHIEKHMEMPAFILALHVSPDLPAGFIGYRKSAFMSSSEEVLFIVKGRGGHGAAPHLAVNPILPSAEIILSLQSAINSIRNPLEPVVFTITSVEAPSPSNVIPEKTIMRGTFRTFSEQTRETIKRKVIEMVTQICRAHGATCTIEFKEGSPVLVNDDLIVERAVSFFNDDPIIRMVEVPMRMGTDDFAYFLKLCPGALFRLGCSKNPSEAAPLHSPFFLPEPETIKYGIYFLLCTLHEFTKIANPVSK